VKRESIAGQDLVDRKGSDRIAELVLNPVVGAGVEMTGRARHAAVAARLHVPKESFA
jgi:hypothetical protein